MFPVAPRSLWQILAPAAVKCGSDALAFLADGFDALPSPAATDLKSITRRHRDKKLLAEMLSKLLSEDAAVGERDRRSRIGNLNADPDLLHEFLEQQNYRVAYWRMATRDLGYRRFFDINSLVGLRIENERVFDATHKLVMRWVARRPADGTASRSSRRIARSAGILSALACGVPRYLDRGREDSAWLREAA